MSQFIKENIAIICSKQVKNDFKHIFVSNSITIFNFLDKAGSFGSGFIFPKYLFFDEIKAENIHPKFKDFIERKLKWFEYHDVFNYIYSILHSPTYRNKYREFLKVDFPRIPFIEDKNIFKQLAEMGNQLIKVHLLEQETDYTYGDFLGKGDSILEKPNFIVTNNIGKLYINKTQYFNNIPQEVYDFYIGGYQVLDKYLKDRKDRELSTDEVENIEKTVKAIAFTIDQMKKIDNLTKNWI